MILTTLVAAVVLGIAAQVIAERIHLPAILPLLLLGIGIGPSGLGLFDPGSLGDVLENLIHLGVAIILFEGGLSLEPRRLLQVGAAVRNLLTLGVAVSGVGCAVLAHLLGHLPWSIAAVFGAIMTVTGPTVITPLLRFMIAPRRTKTILVSEGLMIDPIGAVLAYMVLQYIQRAGIPWRVVASDLLVLTMSGAILGFAAGAACRSVLRTRLVGAELRNLFVLAVLMLGYLIAEMQAPQSGILASVVMGLTMSAADVPDLFSLRAFKGQLSTLVISALFILLAGQLDLSAVVALGWGGVAVVAAMMLLVRPAAVAVSVMPAHLPWRERLLLMLTAPRGIVAAAVASLAARSLLEAGIEGGRALEGLVYLAILVTGAGATLVAVTLPRALGFDKDPSRRLAVLVGAHRLTEVLATVLEQYGRSTVVVDAAAWRLDRFRSQGLKVVCGDARDALSYQEAGVERDSMVVAATTNDELNLLVAQLVRDQFGVEHPAVALQSPPEELRKVSRAWIDLLGNGAADLPTWIRRLEGSAARVVELDLEQEEAAATLREAEREHGESIVRLLVSSGSDIGFDVSDERLENGSRLAVLVLNGKASELLERFIIRPPEPSDASERADELPASVEPSGASGDLVAQKST